MNILTTDDVKTLLKISDKKQSKGTYAYRGIPLNKNWSRIPSRRTGFT